MKLVLIFCTIFFLTLHLNTKCTPPASITQPNQITTAEQSCPVNSHCLENGFCDCDLGFVGGCSQKAYRMENGIEIAANVANQGYTFFEIIGSTETYTLLSFHLCLQEKSASRELFIDVWDDDGTLDQLTKQNAEIGGKAWRIEEGCLTLNTPFMMFGTKMNGQTEGFILGLRSVQKGTLGVSFKVDIIELNFWDMMVKIILILGGCFLLVLSAAIAYVVYKWRRRRLFRSRAREQDTSHLELYMPKMKLERQTNAELVLELCSICLLELGEMQYLRRTVCYHLFHQDCLDSWCRNHLSCPVCRRSFQLDDLKGDSPTFDLTEASNIRQVIL